VRCCAICKHITFASELTAAASASAKWWAPIDLFAAMHVELAPIVLLTSPAHTKEFERIERYIKHDVRCVACARHGRERVCRAIAPPRRASCRARATTTTLASARVMLFHGTRKTNLMSLFRNGVQVAPAEAPLTGAMFGRAIYASSCASKSAQYCRVDRKAPRGVLLLLAVRSGQVGAAALHGFGGGTKCGAVSVGARRGRDEAMRRRRWTSAASSGRASWRRRA
jgi:hypothetical protein